MEKVADENSVAFFFVCVCGVKSSPTDQILV